MLAILIATPSLTTQELCKFKVEVDVLGSPSLIYCPYGLWGRKTTLNLNFTLLNAEFRNCANVEVAVLGSPVLHSPYGLWGRKATLNLNFTLLNAELRNCVSVEVDVLSSQSLI